MPNQLFGYCRNASKTDGWEVGVGPTSLMQLDKDTCKLLNEMAEAGKGRLAYGLLKSITFLWAMDQDQRIFLAVEELSPSHFNAYGAPRIRGVKVDILRYKLGHPTLLDGRPARIAGELYFYNAGGGPKWYINCGSGRFCAPPNSVPTREQLRNVIKRFQDAGLVDVEPDEDFCI